MPVAPFGSGSLSHPPEMTSAAHHELAASKALSPAGQSPAIACQPAHPPRRAEGLELIGEYQGAGFADAPYLVRRSDGQVVQLSRLLYLVAAHADGWRDTDVIAERLCADLGRPVSAQNVEYLIEGKLRPVGVIAAADGSLPPKLTRRRALLGLNFRVPVVRARAVGAVADVLRPLFARPVWVTVLAGLLALDVWLFAVHGAGRGLRDVLYNPALLLAFAGVTVASAAFHELGHATACRSGGGRPGAIGVGLYLIWPVFYSNVTDAYRLSRVGRLRTDLGGVYFNAIILLALGGAYFATSFEPLLALIVTEHLRMLYQFVPWLRLDGYYVVSDLAGVPDVFSRLRPTLVSLVPGRPAHPLFLALRPAARRVLAGYLLTLVPVLGLVVFLLATNLPWIWATAWESCSLHAAQAAQAAAQGGVLEALVRTGEALLALAPMVGVTLALGLLALRFGRKLARRIIRATARADVGAVASAPAAERAEKLPLHRPPLVVGFVTTPRALDRTAVQLAVALRRHLQPLNDGAPLRVELAEHSTLMRAADTPELVEALRERMLAEDWQLAIGLTDLPLRVRRRTVAAQAWPLDGVALLSLPGLAEKADVRATLTTIVEDLLGEAGGRSSEDPRRRRTLERHLAALRGAGQRRPRPTEPASSEGSPSTGHSRSS